MLIYNIKVQNGGGHMYQRYCKITAFLLLTLIISTLTSCGAGEKALSEPVSKQEFLLDTYVTITLYDKGDVALIDECFDLINSYEEMLSRTKENSDISKLNKATEFPVEVQPETAELINIAMHYATISDGAFDPSIEPISKLWEFKGSNKYTPTDTDIIAELSNVEYKKIKINENFISFDSPNMGLDLGAIAKGFIADKVKDHLLSKGVHSAIINLGGNVLCIGSKPDGSPFKIGIQKPFEDYAETVGAVAIKDVTVVSSGIYERCFTTEDGKFYHHILNPDTGYPYDNELVAVTIITPKSVDGDGLSTTCFALGTEKGLELINSLPDTYAVFIDKQGNLTYSDGFEDLLIEID